jgi:hypothetical protein
MWELLYILLAQLHLEGGICGSFGIFCACSTKLYYG